MMFAAGVHYFYFIIIILLIPAFLALIFFSRGTNWQLVNDYQFNRIDTFLNPGKDPLGDGYQITQSKIALGSGGFEGKGFMQGSQSQLDFLPINILILFLLLLLKNLVFLEELVYF